MNSKASSIKSNQNAEANSFNKLYGWRRFFFKTQTLILLWYVVLTVLSTTVFNLTIRYLFLVRLEQRIEKSLDRRVEEFRRFVDKYNLTTVQLSKSNLTNFFNLYLSQQVPEKNEFLFLFADSQLYKSASASLPEPLKQNSDLVNNWTQLNQPEQGKKLYPTDTILYLAEPLDNRGIIRGVFVVAYSTSSSRQWVNDAIFIVNWGSTAVLTVAFLLAWLTSGSILNSLRILTASARSISKIDLSQRIPVQGTNEVAELTITLNNMLARLQAAFASQQDFLNDATHELQAPITIIRCHLDLLGNDLQEWLETKKFIIDELDRMSRIVNDLLLLTKLEQPNFLTLEILDISSLTEDLYTKVKAIANRNWCLDAKASGRIITDRHRLTQAIINLARNAAQHTIDGDVIGFGSAFTDNGARFWVRDTGKGIDPSDQHRIFERFVRAANDGNHPEGTGLGLAIVRKIAEAHGGRVELSSRLGAGSTFTVVIPFDVF